MSSASPEPSLTRLELREELARFAEEVIERDMGKLGVRLDEICRRLPQTLNLSIADPELPLNELSALASGGCAPMEQELLSRYTRVVQDAHGRKARSGSLTTGKSGQRSVSCDSWCSQGSGGSGKSSKSCKSFKSVSPRHRSRRSAGAALNMLASKFSSANSKSSEPPLESEIIRRRRPSITEQMAGAWSNSSDGAVLGGGVPDAPSGSSKISGPLLESEILLRRRPSITEQMAGAWSNFSDGAVLGDGVQDASPPLALLLAGFSGGTVAPAPLQPHAETAQLPPTQPPPPLALPEPPQPVATPPAAAEKTALAVPVDDPATAEDGRPVYNLSAHRRNFLAHTEKKNSVEESGQQAQEGVKKNYAQVVPVNSLEEDGYSEPSLGISEPQETTSMSVRRIVESAYFDYLSAVLIMLNAISLGLQTDYMARELTAEEPLVLAVIEKIFCFCFTAELVLRLIVHRLQFFWMPGWRWNLFDCLIVGMQLAEEVVAIIAVICGSSDGYMQTSEQSDGSGRDDDGGAANFSVLRVIRVLRLVRIVRLARIMHLISELRTIVVSIFSSMQSLMWTMALLLIIIYIIAVYITQMVTDHMVNGDTEHLMGDLSELRRLYGSVGRSILSLFQFISGGISWDLGLDPLMVQISPWLGILFSLYIGFAIFALMNITTGVFVENALKTANKDQELFLMHHADQLFRKVDLDQSGDISWDEFSSQLETQEMQLYFKAIDLDPCEADDLFKIIDFDGKGTIDADEFVYGCLRLRGTARAIDLAAFMQSFVKTSHKIQTSLNCLLSRMTEVSRAVA